MATNGELHLMRRGLRNAAVVFDVGANVGDRTSEALKINSTAHDGSVPSLSCLHVAEHIGPERYGSPLNPHGTRHACAELRQALAPGSNLYFSLPVGRPRVCFNAHRIHVPETIVEYFAGLKLVEFSGMHDDGRYVERVCLDEFTDSRYANGMFWFQKSGARACFYEKLFCLQPI